MSSGDIDLVGRDFRAADLSKNQLVNRDFTRAHLENAKLVYADITISNFNHAFLSNLNASFSIAREIIANHTAIVLVDFSNSDLSHAKLQHAHFTRANFDNANLCGANFTGAFINEGSSFKDCLVDDDTLFDNVHIFRPLAREPAFRNYRVERGVLIRTDPRQTVKSEEEIERSIEANDRSSSDLNSPAHDIQQKIDIAIKSLDSDQIYIEPTHGNMGHNNPPDDSPLGSEDIKSLRRALFFIKANLEDKAKADQIAESNEHIVHIGLRISRWIADKMEIVATEFAKEAGKTLASKTVFITAWLTIFGYLQHITQHVASFLSVFQFL